jgi:hypothetical protein
MAALELQDCSRGCASQHYIAWQSSSKDSSKVKTVVKTVVCVCVS